jgi:hypothetical protein
VLTWSTYQFNTPQYSPTYHLKEGMLLKKIVEKYGLVLLLGLSLVSCDKSPVVVTERVITPSLETIETLVLSTTPKETAATGYHPSVTSTLYQISTSTMTPSPANISWQAISDKSEIINNLRTATKYRLPYWAKITEGELYLKNSTNAYQDVPVIEISEIQGDFGVRYTIVFETSSPHVSLNLRDKIPAGGTWWKGSRRIDLWLQNNQLSVEYRHGESEQKVGQYYHQKYFPFVTNQPYEVAAHFIDGEMEIIIEDKYLGTISTKDIFENGTMILSINLSPQDAVRISDLVLEFPPGESENFVQIFP